MRQGCHSTGAGLIARPTIIMISMLHLSSLVSNVCQMRVRCVSNVCQMRVKCVSDVCQMCVRCVSDACRMRVGCMLDACRTCVAHRSVFILDRWWARACIEHVLNITI